MEQTWEHCYNKWTVTKDIVDKQIVIYCHVSRADGIFNFILDFDEIKALTIEKVARMLTYD